MTSVSGPALLERIRAVPPRPRVIHKHGHRQPRVETSAVKNDRTAAVEKKNREVTEYRTKQIREVLADGLEHTVGEIAQTIGFGIAPTGQLVRHLVNVRELVCQMRDGNKNWYRLPQPGDVFTTPVTKAIAIPTFDSYAFAQRLEQLLASGASYDLRELVRNMRNTWPQADDANVTGALEQLHDAGKVERVALGSVAVPAQGASGARATSTILPGNALEVLRTLPEASVHCAVTSPPYWSLRDYGVPPSIWGGDARCEHCFVDEAQAEGYTSKRKWQHSENGRGEHDQGATCKKCGAWLGCLGLEPTPALYVEHLALVFDEVFRVLRADGTCWLNLGDCYAAGGRGGYTGDASTLQGSHRHQEESRAAGQRIGSRPTSLEVSSHARPETVLVWPLMPSLPRRPRGER